MQGYQHARKDGVPNRIKQRIAVLKRKSQNSSLSKQSSAASQQKMALERSRGILAQSRTGD